MNPRVRFAPSPTGQVHIGNIRTAIFNWLFARHTGGSFLLRIEDTDRDRSTAEAIAELLSVMAWLELDFDEEPLYQSSRAASHVAAAETLLTGGQAYRDAKGEGGEATVFRIPWQAPTNLVRDVGTVTLPVHPGVPLALDRSGLHYAAVSKKGKAVETDACLAGFRQLQAFDAAGTCVYQLEPDIDAILAGASRQLDGVVELRFLRREVFYEDLVKGPLAKPLDSMRDQVIVRSDGLPVFHLANVCDDLDQRVTHIIRGDDHVENTYRHLLLFAALGAEPPAYAHLPMIVNAAGKPFSKRDGDAYVGDFRRQGYLPEALFNFLTLLGWSPGDDREKLSRAELVAAFALERVLRSPAQMDLNKLTNLNGQYLADLPFDRFVAECRAAAGNLPWAVAAGNDEFQAVARLMQSRTKVFADVADWVYFFTDSLHYNDAAVRKGLQKPGVGEALTALADRLTDGDFSVAGIEAVIHATTEALGIDQGKLNLPIRVAVTGTNVGAGLYESMALLGRDRSLARLRHAVEHLCQA